MEQIDFEDPRRTVAALQQVASEQAAQLAQSRVNYTKLETAFREVMAENNQLTAELEKAKKGPPNRATRRAAKK